MFPSPHSGILFLYSCIANVYDGTVVRFRPLIRGFFFYEESAEEKERKRLIVSVPSFGDSFFIIVTRDWNNQSLSGFPSPHSGILFLYQPQLVYEDTANGFRPLIRGFFFYPSIAREYPNYKDMTFPSPHSGILFLFREKAFNKRCCSYVVSVPSFGDSFFIEEGFKDVMYSDTGFRPLIRGFFFYE